MFSYSFCVIPLTMASVYNHRRVNVQINFNKSYFHTKMFLNAKEGSLEMIFTRYLYHLTYSILSAFFSTASYCFDRLRLTIFYYYIFLSFYRLVFLSFIHSRMILYFFYIGSSPVFIYTFISGIEILFLSIRSCVRPSCCSSRPQGCPVSLVSVGKHSSKTFCSGFGFQCLCLFGNTTDCSLLYIWP